VVTARIRTCKIMSCLNIDDISGIITNKNSRTAMKRVISLKILLFNMLPACTI
jgi:hypothetical protein